MSKFSPTKTERAALRFTCNQCGSPPQTWCMTKTLIHDQRVYVAKLHMSRIRYLSADSPFD